MARYTATTKCRSYVYAVGMQSKQIPQGESQTQSNWEHQQSLVLESGSSSILTAPGADPHAKMADPPTRSLVWGPNEMVEFMVDEDSSAQLEQSSNSCARFQIDTHLIHANKYSTTDYVFILHDLPNNTRILDLRLRTPT